MLLISILHITLGPNEIGKGSNLAAVKQGLVKGVMTRSIIDVLSELGSPFLKGGNSAFITTIASGPFPQTEYRSLE